MSANYLSLYQSGELRRRVEHAQKMLAKCTLCLRSCKIDRTQGKEGFCRSGITPVISSYGPHLGEEPPISGTRGSGTIFFTGCNLRCLFCQNYQISQEYQGHPVSVDELARMMLSLQKQGCHNINLVTPTHFVPQILEALLLACEQGLNLPLVYNTNGYDALKTLKLLDDIIDIYLPDIKYSDDKSARACSEVADYVRHNRLALKEMYRQVGNLKVDEANIAVRGMIIRHLVLPERLAGSFASLDFIVKEISKEAVVGLMAQYHPCYKAHQHPVLNRRLTHDEYAEVVEYAESLGLDNCLVQALTSSDDFLPDFRQEKPFKTTNTLR